MHPLVRDLYKRFLWVGRDYPMGYAYVRSKAKEAILKNATLSREEDLLRAVHKGRWWVNELIGVVKMKKYRAMRQRYGTASDMSPDEYKKLEAAAMADAAEIHRSSQPAASAPSSEMH